MDVKENDKSAGAGAKGRGAVTVFIYMAGAEQPKVEYAAEDELLTDVLRRAGLEVGADATLLSGEPAVAADADESMEAEDDEHDAVKADARVGEMAKGRRVHVHCHICRRVTVEVRYQAKSARRKFSPARKIADVRKWALKKFKLTDPAAADKLVLELCDDDTHTQPRDGDRVGEWVEAGSCDLCLELVQQKAVEGCP